MSSGNSCNCGNSSKNLRESEPNIDVDENLKPRGRHAVHRKKYKPNELNTAGLQCNYDICSAMAVNAQAIDIQCDLEPDEDDVESICSFCRCTSGFCNERCEMAKRKMGKNRSDSWKCPKNSGIPVAVKRNSSPGLGSVVADPNTACKCTGKCTRECEKRKLTEAMDAMRKKKIEKKRSPNVSMKCAQNQCRSACNTKVQTDMDEPPIAPLAPVPIDNPTMKIQPQSIASNVCIACQCTGLCSIECTMQKQDITQQNPAEDLQNTCFKCDCTGECNPICQKDKERRAQISSVCDICKCSDVCSKECTEKKAISKQNQTNAQAPTCNCETMYTRENDEFKETQTIPDKAPSKANQEVVCAICECVGACNENCKAALNAQKQQNSIPLNSNTLICKPKCLCPNDCNEVCQATKTQTKKVKEPPMICEVCNCPGPCTPECESKKTKKERSSKDLKFQDEEISEPPPPPEASTPVDPPSTPQPENLEEPEVTDNSTQVKGGIMEEYKDDDTLIENVVDNEPTPSKTKAKSSCDLPDEPICEVCDCTETCQSKCAAIRKIKSIAEFPPNNTVCEDCKCVDICTRACEVKKGKITCVSAAGQPLKCDDTNVDWIPCVTCKSNTPCSPECRERMARAFVMPKPAERGSTASEVSPVAPRVDVQCSTPEGAVTCATVQTPVEAMKSCGVETRRSSADGNAVAACTSTQQGLISRKELERQETCGKGSKADAKRDKSAGSLLTGVSGECPCDSKQECGMCVKLRSYITSIFKNEENNSCGQNKKQDDKKDKKEPHARKKLSDDSVVCRCLESFAKAEKNNQPLRKSQGDENGGRPSKCSKTMGRKNSSYTDRMQCMLSRLRTSCEDAELVTTPFIKAASAFTLDVNNQQEAICALLQKCKQKDHYIDALIDDLLERSKSKVFNNLLGRLNEQNPAAPDFDGTLILSALDQPRKSGPVCGIDLAGFKICSVKRMGATSLLVKWNPPIDGKICGYDILVNTQLKTRITNKERLYAILDALDFSGTISIEIYAMTPNGRAFPSLLAYYAKY